MSLQFLGHLLLGHVRESRILLEHVQPLLRSRAALPRLIFTLRLYGKKRNEIALSLLLAIPNTTGDAVNLTCITVNTSTGSVQSHLSFLLFT